MLARNDAEIEAPDAAKCAGVSALRRGILVLKRTSRALFALAAVGLITLSAASSVRADRRYLNFDPDGRLAILDKEARVEAAKAAAIRNRLERNVVIQIILNAAADTGQDPALVLAVAMAESRLDPFVVSPMGAQGLMQLMPPTARRFGCTDPFDAYQNAKAGARYLGFLLNRYNGNVRLALAAYNAGPAPVDRLSDVPPIGETQAFVVKVTRFMDEIRLELP